MKTSDFKRRLRFLERHAPWFVLAALVSGGLCALVIFISSGILEDVDPIWLGRNIRGYTLIGYALGILAVLLAALTFTYSFRKRSLQEKLPLRGTMMMWLWAHVYLGLLALLAAALHGGYGVFSLGFSSGKILFWLFFLMVLSGVAWRLVYRLVPPVAQPQIRNYSQRDAAGRAHEQQMEIEKLAAGESDALRQLANSILSGAQPTEIRAALRSLTPAEQAKMAAIQKLADSRRRALQRHRLQTRFTTLLQGWKILHVPLVVLFLLFFVLHLIAVFDIPSRLLPAQFQGFANTEDCSACHQAITAQWRESMHAHALTSPVTIVQTNQVIAKTVSGQPSPDPFMICNNCHGPVGAKLTGQASLPLDAPFPMDAQTINDGVSCAVCHQFTGEPASGAGGLAAVFQKGLAAGGVFFGPIADPVGNAYHRSNTTPMYQTAPESLCQNCHNVNYDLNADGRIEPGVDLILQTTYDEYEDYRAAGGAQNCLDCHMPLIPGETRVAEAAGIPFQQDFPAPPRLVHSHGFVGVDYPLDTVAVSDPQQAARAALLQSAAQITLSDDIQISADGNSATFSVDITNVGAGHQLPTGFAFARQMWIEVVVTDGDGNLLLASGVLASNTDDLCDTATLNDALAGFVTGCPGGADPQLVNFQQKLLDIIDIKRDDDGTPVLNDDGDFIVIQAVNGEETFLQHLTGGAIARLRPSDGQVLTRIDPGGTRTFAYTVPLNGDRPDEIVVTVRLLFRNLPAYFLRVLAENQPAGEFPQLEPLIGNLQIVEMASEEETYP